MTIDVSGDTANVLGSPALMQQLITNLVHNAIVHNLRADGTVTVRTHALPEAVALVVENTGQVLPAHRVAILAEPFQRGSERTRDDDHGGVGLRLAIVHHISAGARRIARAHGPQRRRVERDGVAAASAARSARLSSVHPGSDPDPDPGPDSSRF